MNNSDKRTLDEEDDTSLSKRLCTEERQLDKTDEVSENSLPEDVTSARASENDVGFTELEKRLLDKTDQVSENSLPEDVTPSARASENDVGITEYVSELPGFSAVMKERFSDFLVNEIDTQGNIIRLSDMTKPKNPEQNYKADDLLDEETIQKLQDLASKNISEVAIDVTDADKDRRKDLHVAIRLLALNLDSCTEDRNSKKYIVVKNQNSGKGKRFQPSTGGNYLHFVLYKENKDTMDAINNISSFLRVQPKAFSYAGSKDKRGKTSQLVSAYRMNPAKLLSINLKFNMIKVGNIVYKNEQLRLGDLWGNKFIIILRQMKGEPDIVEQSMKSLSQKGFINYYGMQRFGTSSIPTHAIGRALLREDWSGAVNLILTPRSEDDYELVQAKKIWLSTKNAKRALGRLKKKWSMEAKLLSGLATAHKNDFFNAFGAVPRNMRLMYIHSYQSFIWNKVASKRIKTHGLKVLTGDLVPREPGVLVDNYEPDDEDDNRKAALSRMVTVLSEEDVDKYSISDVLLPLPGHSVVFPNNETKEYYDDFLKEDGMEWSNFDSKIKSYSLSGAYRKLIVIPEDLKWEIIPYSDVTKPLALSDLDKMKNLSLGLKNSGPLTSLKLEFKLPPSAYATMAVREILRQSTYY